MIRIKMAFLLCSPFHSFGVFRGQTFVETRARRWRHAVAQSQPQSPAESSVIVVKPGLTDEQLADLYMARRTIERRASYKRLADQSPQNPCIQ